MRLTGISNDFFKLCPQECQLLWNENGYKRLYLVILKLKYKGSYHEFAIPTTSNIKKHIPDNQYFKLPVNKNTQKGNHHGLVYIKMFPIKVEYLTFFRTDNNPYYIMLKNFIISNKAKIVKEAQEYLINYETGKRVIDKHRNAIINTDIEAIYTILNPPYSE